MTSVASDISYASAVSKAILDNVSQKSETRLFKMEAKVSEKMVTAAWNAFGLYLTRIIRSGKAITIPKFGIITFSAPYVKLEGVTNPEQRDLRQRIPVFLVNKEFVKGLTIQTGIVSGGTIRPFSMKGVISGLGQVKINYTEIGFNAGMDKDIAKTCIERVIRELADKAKTGKSVEMEIPDLGKLLIRNQTAAIEFDDFLVNDALDATNKVARQKQLKIDNSSLTALNLRDFMTYAQPKEKFYDDGIKLDSGAQTWLRTNLNIDTSLLKTISRPQTAKSINLRYSSGLPFMRPNTSETDSVRSRPVSNCSSVRPSTAKMLRSSHISEEKVQFMLLENAKKKIKLLIRTHSLLPEEGFYEIIKFALGPNAPLTLQMTYIDFKRGLGRISGLNLDAKEIEAVAKILDPENQNKITLENWIKIFGDDRSYLNYIKDVITRYNLQIDDILRRMGLTRNAAAQTTSSLKEKLKLLDPSLNDTKAIKVAQEILRGKEKIEINDLIEVLGCQPNNTREGDDWYTNQLMLIKRKVKDVLKLREYFEKYDEKSQGLLEVGTFKTALLKFGFGFTVEDVKRFTRYVEKDTDLMVDYVKFVEILDKIKTETELQTLSMNHSFIHLEQFNVINDKLQEYLASNKITGKELIKKVIISQTVEPNDTRKVLNEQFAQFLQQICKASFIKKKNCLEFAQRMDIDKDGFINDTDIETFMARNSYIKEGEKEIVTSNSVFAESKLFPKKELSEEKVEVVLRDLRQALNKKKISFYDFFKMIDVKQTGFVTINDFCTGVDKVVKLSQPIKDGFFAYIDIEKIGIINYDDFVKVLKRSVLDKRVDVTEDSFDWQNNALDRIKEYAREKNLRAEDTFRILDTDFDGFISKNDLHRFLKEVLNYKDLTQTRVERLLKLMDIYKRGCVQLSDLKIILNNNDNQNNVILSGGNDTIKKSNFDWRLHARQQMGLWISKHFSDLSPSFDVVAERQVNMKYTQFVKWIENNRILTGFDMTDKLIQKLFADLDPHKKGYLTEADWVNAFTGYNARNQMIFEVQEALYANHSTIENAFDFFLSHETQINNHNMVITFPGFQKAVNALIPKRFENDWINFVWDKCVGDKKEINLKRFNDVFGNKKFHGSSFVATAKSVQASMAFTRPNTSYATMNRFANTTRTQAISKEEKQRKVFEKLRQILLSANVSVEKFFQQVDADGSGELSNLEFINCIKHLNLGLPLQEIEDLLIYCDSNQDGRISFQEFVRKFAPQVVESRLFERAKNRLKKFKDNIYIYMLSPKDAFLNFNEDRTGRMTYDQFNKLIAKLHQLTREEVPAFPIIKDLFDFLDIRKDGIIDMNEWMQSFRLIENNAIGADTKDTLPKRRAMTVDVRSLNKTYYSNPKEIASASKGSAQTTTNTALNVSTWECSKEYEKILKLIGKNRKGLINTFDDLKKKGILIDAAKIKEIIGELLKTTGLKITEEQWLYMYKFAEKDGVVDYKFMLEIFKERLYLLSAHPRTSVGQY